MNIKMEIPFPYHNFVFEILIQSGYSYNIKLERIVLL